MINNLSLVKRLICFYLIGPLLIFIIFSFLIVWFANKQAAYELQLSVESDLKRTIDTVDETIETLSMVVEQMSFGYLSTNLRSMLIETNPYEKSCLIKDLSNEINIISFTNTKIGLMGYYDQKEKRFIFVTNGATSDAPADQESLLVRQNAFSFYGPHTTRAHNYSDLVISVTKDVPSAEHVTAYVEFKLDLHLSDPFLQNSGIVIANAQGQILYNDGVKRMDTERSPENAKASAANTIAVFDEDNDLSTPTASGTYSEYLYTRMQSAEGYYVYLFTPRREFSQYFQTVLPNVLLSILCLGIIFTGIVIMLARNIFSPLRIFEKEIRKIQQGDLSPGIPQRTELPEYDRLLDEVFIMKRKIRQLIDDVTEAQKQQAKLKTDQLLYKINPHFLMNSLDTIHWLAVSQNTQEIDKVACALNKLLYYNLKIDKNLVYVADELNAVSQYILLQQSRFHFHFELSISDKTVETLQIPRFILQPLVENAIYHGIHEDGQITLTVSRNEKLIFSVKDNGNGVDASTLKELLHSVSHPSDNNRLGIGLNYVIQVLNEQYGKNAFITIDSTPGNGTEIRLILPVNEALHP